MSDDLVVAAADAIIAAAAVKKRHRKRRSCWVRDWRPYLKGTRSVDQWTPYCASQAER